MKSLADLRARWGDPLLTALTVLLAAVIFLIAPLQAAGLAEAQDLGFAVVAIVIGAVVIISGSSVAIFVMLVAFGLAATAAIMRLHEPSEFDLFLRAIAWLLMSLALIWVTAQAVFASGRITYHRIMGAILLYLAVGWSFAGLFLLIGLVFPHAFDGMSIKDGPALASQLAYLSFGTLTTAGSGDITPIHPLARSLTNLEAMVGQLYPATLLARLVTLEVEDSSRR
jgi:hypothetical protein